MHKGTAFDAQRHGVRCTRHGVRCTENTAFDAQKARRLMHGKKTKTTLQRLISKTFRVFQNFANLISNLYLIYKQPEKSKHGTAFDAQRHGIRDTYSDNRKNKRVNLEAQKPPP
jgi:hypothetical protein